jgi:hypothetical protein
LIIDYQFLFSSYCLSFWQPGQRYERFINQLNFDIHRPIDAV